MDCILKAHKTVLCNVVVKMAIIFLVAKSKKLYWIFE